ncbi:MAG: hypothetical protein QME79_07730 [Bacillota bacterium]|nr:hypothetical protein [Bacillota bacterium]
MPRWLDSNADALRATNDDLSDFDDLELANEAFRVRQALANLGPGAPQLVFIGRRRLPARDWLLLRLAAIRRERQARWREAAAAW